MGDNLSKNTLIEILQDLNIQKDKLVKYLNETKDYGYTEDAWQNIEDAISNIEKQINSD